MTEIYGKLTWISDKVYQASMSAKHCLKYRTKLTGTLVELHSIVLKIDPNGSKTRSYHLSVEPIRPGCKWRFIYKGSTQNLRNLSFGCKLCCNTTKKADGMKVALHGHILSLLIWEESKEFAFKTIPRLKSERHSSFSLFDAKAVIGRHSLQEVAPNQKRECHKSKNT